MGTENAMLAATLAEGHTTIRPAAREPEVDDLIAFLQKMGADVERTSRTRSRSRASAACVAPSTTWSPTGSRPARSSSPAAVTGGRVTLEGAPCAHLTAMLETLDAIGLPVHCDGDSIDVDGTALERTGYRACDIETAPYPGLATDLQPPTCVLLTQAVGTSHVHETIFEDRLDWLSELRRMGADVEIVDAHHARITGRCRLHGADVEIGDLRAGASLMLAALAADGQTTIHGAHHVHRGYENIERKFLDLGARIERVAEGVVTTSS